MNNATQASPQRIRTELTTGQTFALFIDGEFLAALSSRQLNNRIAIPETSHADRQAYCDEIGRRRWMVAARLCA